MFKGLAVLLFLFIGVAVQGQTVSISDANASEDVASGTMDFTVTAINVAPLTQVNYSFPAGGTATGGGVDYTGTPGTLTFIGLLSVETQTISVPINNDNIVEGSETFTVQLGTPTLGATLSGSGIGTGTITNDDKASVTIADVSGAEDGGPITVTAILDNPVAGGFTVQVSTSDGTATIVDNDYTAISGQVLTFLGTAGENQQFTITPTADTKIENDETVFVSMSNLASTTLGANIDISDTGTVTITNDDTASLSIADATVAEDVAGGNMVFTVTLNNAVAGGTIVAYTFTDGTATGGGVDYTGTAGNLNFTGAVAGQTRTITVPIVNDNIVEGTETFTVQLGTPTNGVTLAKGAATGTITDNDTASLSIADATVAEDVAGGNMVFTVTLNNAVAGGTTVAYTFADGTATGGGVDYTGTAGNLNFTGAVAGQTRTITVPIVNDNIVEGTETFTVQLGTPTNGVTLAKGTATGTITNDDTGIAIQTAGVTHPEGNSGPTVFAFTVTRTGNLSLANSVAYAVTGSGPNPANGADFVGGTPPASSVNFAAGSTTATITINVNGDRLVEPNETFTVTLSNPTNGAALGNATAVGTITNDDSCAAGTTAPVLDSSVPTAYCNIVNRDLDDFTNSPVPPNSVLVWSTNSNPLIVADHLVGSIATTAGTYYGFFYDSLNNCASSTLQVTLTLNTSPFAGPDVNVAACNSTDTGGSTTLDLDLQLTGEDPGGTWTITTDPSGGMIIGAGNVVDFSGLAVNSVYVFTYTTNNAVAPCVNDTATVSVTVTDCTCPAGNVAPVLDTSVPTAFCDIIAQDLNEYTNSVPPAGTALTWSTNPDPTVANAHIFSDVDAPGTYYGFFYDAVDNCGSPVLTVNLTINTTPEVLNTIPGSRCGIGTVTLGGTRDPGAVLNWYDSETGGTFLGTGTSFVTPSIAETTTFYVEATANGCTSERTAVTATVYEQPNPGVANNTSACSLAEGFTTVDLNTRLVGADPGVWTITSVPTGSTVTIGPNNIVDFVGQPDGDYIFTYTTNTAQAPCTDPSTTLTVSVSPSDCAPNDIDLELVKQVDKGSVDVGGQVTFTLALTNLSDIQATNIIVSDPLGISYGFPYVASTPSKGTYNNITGEWAIDVLEPHESISLILVASVPVEGTFTNMAMITASFPNDGNPANNESSVEVEVLSTVCLQIFNQISPNGDGINDEFIINCIRNYKNNKLEIFDRYGNKVFSKTNYDNTWSGTGKNGDLPKGTYFYSLDLGDGSAGKTGWIQIIR